MAPWGFHHLNHWGGRTRFAQFLAERRLCLDAIQGEILQQKITHMGREKKQQTTGSPQQDGSGECIWNISEQIQGSSRGTMGQRPKLVRGIVLKCVMLHSMLMHSRAEQTTTGILLREAKHKQDILKDYFNHLGALAGQEDRI